MIVVSDSTLLIMLLKGMISMSTKEIAYSIIDTLTEEQLQELLLFLKGYKKEKTSHTVVKAPKVGRNDPCPCGSGKKYKKCCGK